ncbi:hypothetical protein KGF56_002165 [Candida oxycetoniae]|uniref:Rhodanese domain-containing protein n=1 Tax=Candida oxycetoniae TaxID=497107 RepID=A0AAI9WYN0_9ASCO|nr:uncharacterized protein KGF56_002165 [Candida oxycetoniae]KAI3405000.2 hypothetical protein KGF56_002165 [Candida oxycetoniae]
MYSLRQLAQRAPIASRTALKQSSCLVIKQQLRHFIKPSLVYPFNSKSSSFTAVNVNKQTQNSTRFYSVLTETQEAKIYDYNKVKDIASNPQNHPDSILIDVREPVEFSDGHIPGAINIPFKSSPGALDLNPEEFQESFGFDKPDKDKELVFYCLGGVRSTAAEELANTFGYKKRGNYLGSYEDWLSHENSVKDKA